MPGPSLAITELPFNKGLTHWSPGDLVGGDHFIGAGRPTDDNLNGMLFVWVDSFGRVRAKVNSNLAGGVDGWPTAMVNTVDLTFNGVPTAAFTQMWIAWTE